MGPFESEEEFDNWCLERVRSSFSRAVWKRLLPRMRGSSDLNFVVIFRHGTSWLKTAKSLVFWIGNTAVFPKVYGICDCNGNL